MLEELDQKMRNTRSMQFQLMTQLSNEQQVSLIDNIFVLEVLISLFLAWQVASRPWWCCFQTDEGEMILLDSPCVLEFDKQIIIAGEIRKRSGKEEGRRSGIQLGAVPRYPDREKK